MRKLISYVLIILTWLVFGYVYFSMYEANRPVNDPEAEAETETSPEGMSVQVLPTSRKIRPDMLCISGSALTDPPWSNAKFQQAVGELNVRTVRIPGGRVAGYWDWRSGEILPDEQRTEPIVRDNNLARLLEGMGATETEPILVLNMLTADLESQLELLETVEAGGVPVQAIELGYGFYQGGPDSDYGQAFPRVEDYTSAAEAWIAAIRDDFPDASLALVGAPPSSGDSGRIQGWNEAVFALAEAEKLAIAMYPFPPRGLEPGQPFNEEHVTAVLGFPFRHWQNYTTGDAAPLANLPADVPVWLTEYNLPEEVEGEAQVSEKWAQSLFVLTQSLLFLEDERVEFICPYQLTGPRQWAALLRHGERYDLMPTGRAVQILGRAMNGMTTARQMEFVNVPVPEGQAYPVFRGWQFEDGDGRRTAVVLNLGSERRELRLTDLPAEFPRRYQQILGVPTGRARNSEGVEVLTGNVVDKNFLIFLPYSVTFFFSET